MNILWWLIPVIIIVLSLGVIIVVFWEKLPQLRKLDVESIPKEQMRQMKEKLIMQRLDRMRSNKLGGVGKAAGVAVKGVSKLGRRAVQRLYALEQYYQKVKQETDGEGTTDPETVKRLLNEAEELVRAEEYIPAEKKYIEVISHHPKNVAAYEGLGNLYLEIKSYDQARETFLFTLRIAPDDASVNMSMAELETDLKNHAKACEFAKKAVDKRPGNPKYLDMYIESALAAKLFAEADQGIELLEQVNPENQKIGDFKERLQGLRDSAGEKPFVDPSQTE
ncbi:tetratricopeptide repeat protein [Patescibacteria group bacterium]|nr:tetratricopeptide repeat protein [Patescibacteria group bacterium]MBU1705769.1 tetratricopeptide repeat protein [Patescibacteria group bacterium]